jgi:hypothetical protein
VSIFIIETGRSYENPIDSYSYQRQYTTDDHPSFSGSDEDGSPYGQITIEGMGPGSYAFGRDEVLTGHKEFISAGNKIGKWSIFGFYNHLEK